MLPSHSSEAVSNENIACIEVSRRIDSQGQTRFTFCQILDEQLAMTKDCNKWSVQGHRELRREVTLHQGLQVQDANIQKRMIRPPSLVFVFIFLF